MQLSRVEIKNFLSVKYAEIDFDPACRVLVGINESGKTNVIKALSLLGEEKPVKLKHVREPLPDESPISSSYVRFTFTLNKSELTQLYKYCQEQVLCKKKNQPIIVTPQKEELDLQKFCNTRNEGLYTANVISEKKSARYWILNDGYEVKAGWKIPSAQCPADFSIEVNDTKVKLQNFKLIFYPDFAEIPEEYLEDATPEKVNSLMGSHITDHVEDNLPEVVLWKYDEDNLLPPSVDVEAFKTNPDSCLPLKNMFILAGIEDIKAEIEDAVTTPNKFRNLLTRVSTHATKHFKSVWKDHKKTSFALLPNSTTAIEANILEENHWSMSQRSDGFKRFITFLLHISANVETDSLNDVLLLIDEPDTSLHPTGSRYLRDELIRIGKKNYVLFSTHSIFMIDKENIGRHIIVKKDNEITTLADVTRSNFVDEEVLMNALNISVFDILKEKNLIFEGWRDKHLFEVALKATKSTRTDLQEDFAEVKKKLLTAGKCHSEGVKDITRITSIIELAGRKCLIVTDSDQPAVEKQKKHESTKSFGEWKTYADIHPDSNTVTAEDFIKNETIEKHLKKISEHFKTEESPLMLGRSNKLEDIRGWLQTKQVPQDEIKTIINTLKENLFNDLKVGEIEASYYVFLDLLAKESFFTSSDEQSNQ